MSIMVEAASIQAGAIPKTPGPVTRLYETRVAEGAVIADQAQRDILHALDRVASDLAAGSDRAAPRKSWFARLVGTPDPTPEPVRGLYLWGGVGRGKSMLMDLLVEAAPTDPARIRRVHFHAFMQEVQAGLDAARKEGHRDAIQPVVDAIADSTRLLCFDEMQITDIADAMIVGRLFQGLFDRGVTVVTTSNRVPEDLYKNGLNRQRFLPFIALIRERLQVEELESPLDYRKNRMRGEEVWFTPLGPAAARQMEAAWDGLTHCAVPEPVAIPVRGRAVELPAFCDKVGRIGFDALCGAALGPADYLAVADAVEVLMIDDIPVLGSENHDKARRFVTLIDALYEAKVRLVASAEVEPAALYPQGEGSFEFERTVSRLLEMQAADWGRGGDAGPEAAIALDQTL